MDFVHEGDGESMRAFVFAFSLEIAFDIACLVNDRVPSSSCAGRS